MEDWEKAAGEKWGGGGPEVEGWSYVSLMQESESSVDQLERSLALDRLLKLCFIIQTGNDRSPHSSICSHFVLLWSTNVLGFCLVHTSFQMFSIIVPGQLGPTHGILHTQGVSLLRHPKPLGFC